MIIDKFLVFIAIVLVFFVIISIATFEVNGETDFREVEFIDTTEYIAVSFSDKTHEYQCTYIDENGEVIKHYFVARDTTIIYNESLNTPYSYISYKQRFYGFPYGFVKELYVNDISLIVETSSEQDNTTFDN